MSGFVDKDRPEEREAPYIMFVIEVGGLDDIGRADEPVEGGKGWGGVVWGSGVGGVRGGHCGSNCSYDAQGGSMMKPTGALELFCNWEGWRLDCFEVMFYAAPRLARALPLSRARRP